MLAGVGVADGASVAPGVEVLAVMKKKINSQASGFGRILSHRFDCLGESHIIYILSFKNLVESR